MRTPAAVSVCSMLAGGVVGLVAGVPPPLAAATAILLSWAAALALLLARSTRAFIPVLAVSFAASGWVLAAVADREACRPRVLDHWKGAARDGPLVIEGRLRADATPSAGGIGLDLGVLAVGAGDARASSSGGVRVSVNGEMAANRAEEWRAGRTVSLPAQLREATRYRNPGVADGRLALARRGTILVGSAKSAALVETVARGAWFEEAAAGARAVARRAVSRHVGRWSPRSAAIVIAILIGDRAGLDDDVERRLQEAGTYHVIAISGGNIAILAALILWGLRLLGAGHRASACAGILILGWLRLHGGRGRLGGAGDADGDAAAGGRPRRLSNGAAERAGGSRSGCRHGDAAVADRRRVRADLRRHARDPGGRITRGGRLAAGRGSPRQPTPGRRGTIPRYLRWPLALLAASVCAELALFPVSAFSFSRVTFAGLVLNFAAIPLMTVVQVAGMLVLPLAALHGGAASMAGWVAHAAAEGLIGSAALVEWWPWLSYRLPPPHPVALAAYYSGWAAWFALVPGRWPGWSGRGRRLARRLSLALVAGSGLWILIEPVTLLVPGVSGVLRVTFLDVGHADAVLVQLPDRRTLLVDTGGIAHGRHVRCRGPCPGPRALAPAHPSPRRARPVAWGPRPRGRRRVRRPRLPAP